MKTTESSEAPGAHLGPLSTALAAHGLSQDPFPPTRPGGESSKI